MLESIFTLVFFAMLIGFGMFFYFVYSKGEASSKRIELDEQKMVEIALMVSQLPEIQCTEGSVEQGACIDMLKLMALSTTSDHPDFKIHYYDLFTYATISIKTVYPEVDPAIPLKATITVADQSGGTTDLYPTPAVDNVEKTAEFTFYDGQPTATLDAGDQMNSRVVLLPVTLRDVRSDKKYFGILEVVVYSIERKMA